MAIKLESNLIEKCRLCFSNRLSEVMDLGVLSSCGDFPSKKDAILPTGQLRLVICELCLLVQLDRNFNLNQLFHRGYGYETSLNTSMKMHVEKLAFEAYEFLKHPKEFSVLDIGSNDGTLLNFLNYYKPAVSVGVDPTIKYFKNKYHENITTFDLFFDRSTQQTISSTLGNKYDLIFTVAMFYDLIDPNEFVECVKEILSSNGIWVVEVSYLYSMLNSNSIDTICHEHIEYYSLNSLNYLLKSHGLKVVEYSVNDSNGGSVRLYISHTDSERSESKSFKFALNQESVISKDIKMLFKEMKKTVDNYAEQTSHYLTSMIGHRIMGLGASTKGNTFLQLYPKIANQLSGIAEVNQNKFGCYTPGTNIEIFSEKEIISNAQNVIFLVLPWHFKSFILTNFKQLMDTGKVKIIFTLPKFEIYPKEI
jgi:SAM-dependent methyltransferase